MPSLATLPRDLALFETGLVFHPREEQAVAPVLPVDRRPSDEELASLNAALPVQPRHVAVVLAGAREQAGWWGKGRPADWADAVEAGRAVAREAGAEVVVRQGQYGPWHPGRCAEFVIGETVVGYAGELHTGPHIGAQIGGRHSGVEGRSHGPQRSSHRQRCRQRSRLHPSSSSQQGEQQTGAGPQGGHGVIQGL